jgi:hypothetical protein
VKLSLPLAIQQPDWLLKNAKGSLKRRATPRLLTFNFNNFFQFKSSLILLQSFEQGFSLNIEETFLSLAPMGESVLFQLILWRRSSCSIQDRGRDHRARLSFFWYQKNRQENDVSRGRYLCGAG